MMYEGALNGKTVELCEAQAVLEVCRWRQSMLHKEQAEQSGAPAPRWGANLLRHGQRLFYVGGWSGDAAVQKGSGSSGSTVMVLNVEQEYERRRRLEDEYKARLERFRYGSMIWYSICNGRAVLTAVRRHALTRLLAWILCHVASLESRSRPKQIWVSDYSSSSQ